MVQRYGGMCSVIGGRKDSGCFIRQVHLETSRLAGCLTPVGVMGEICTVVIGRVGTVRHHASATLMADDVCTIRHHGSRQ